MILKHTSLTLPGREIKKGPLPAPIYKSVMVKSTVTDAGDTAIRTTVLRPGMILVLKTSDGLYYADDGVANASSADRDTPASVSASETADGDWASKTITVTVDGGPSATVTLGGADDTDAEVVTALNADAGFIKLGVIADASGSRVRIHTVEAGSHKTLFVTSNLTTAYGSAGTEAVGTDADYVVLHDYCDMLDQNAVASDAVAKVVVCARFDTSLFLPANTTDCVHAQAKAVLRRNGSLFV